MNFRRRLETPTIGLQLAPMIDVILFLLCFFLLTWNLARYEADLEVKVPVAKEGQTPKRLPGEVIINVTREGKVNINRRPVSSEELKQILHGVIQQYPDQAIILRADQGTEYKYVVGVLDVCRASQVWNIAFATSKLEADSPLPPSSQSSAPSAPTAAPVTPSPSN